MVGEPALPSSAAARTFPFADGDVAGRIRQHDWSKSPLGPIEGWSDTLRTALGLMLNGRQPMFLIWGPERLFLYNDAYAEILADRHPQSLGQPVALVWPEFYQDARDLMDPALAGQSTFRHDIHRTAQMETGRLEGWYSISYTPIHGPDGEVLGAFGAATDTSAHVRTERRLDFLLRLSERLRSASDPDEILAIASRQLGEHLGVSRVGYAEISEDGTEGFVERDWTAPGVPSLAGERRPMASFGPRIVGLVSQGQTLALDDVANDPRSAAYAEGYASIGVRAAIVAPLVRDGRFLAFLYLHEPSPRQWSEEEAALAADVAARTWSTLVRARAESARKRMEAALRESEERFRLIAERAPVMLWMGDAEGGCVYLNRALRDFWGVPEDLAGFTWAATLLEEDAPSLFAVFGEAMAKRNPFEVEARYRRYDGAIRILHTQAEPRFDANGEFMGMVGVNVDVTETRRAATRQQLLINELNHRVKNTLAAVQSIARQTLHAGADSIAAREMLTSRLMAMSAAHDVLTAKSWEGADLGEIITTAVRPFDFAGAGRFELDGPPRGIGPRTALGLSLGLHELATNAAKYGALTAPDGRVAIHWAVDNGDLVLTWRERGGPPVTPPVRQGFGSRLLSRGLGSELGGVADLSFQPEGVVCVIRAKPEA